MAENHFLSSPITLIEGERYGPSLFIYLFILHPNWNQKYHRRTSLEIALEIENVGRKPINFIDVSFEEKFSESLPYEKDYYFCIANFNLLLRTPKPTQLSCLTQAKQPLVICDTSQIKLPLMPFENAFIHAKLVGKHPRYKGLIIIINSLVILVFVNGGLLFHHSIVKEAC